MTSNNNTPASEAQLVIIKAKFNDDIRRFQIDRSEAAKLPERIHEIFGEPELFVTYTDEDGDAITIHTPEDAIEAVSQTDAGVMLRLQVARPQLGERRFR